MRNRLERKFLTWGFLIVGLCLLTISLAGSNRAISLIDAVLGIGSVAIGWIRVRRDRGKRGLLIPY
ncbi:MAG TPA: hypothetical protein VJM78_02155 [Rhizomicrobium sp.]|nr:hypothetical protein [Rhizomicrobium sp.]